MTQKIIDMHRTYALRHEAFTLVMALHAAYTAQTEVVCRMDRIIQTAQQKHYHANGSALRAIRCDEVAKRDRLYRILMKAFKRHERRMDAVGAYDLFI